MPLVVPHCNCAFDAFLLFDKLPNLFLSPRSASRACIRALLASKPISTSASSRPDGSAGCCGARRVGLASASSPARRAAIAGLVIATHAMTALFAAAPACAASRGSCCSTPAWMKRLQQHMDRLDAAARGTYVLNNDVDTIEWLVDRLHATGDKILVRLGHERGRGQHHTIEEVVRQLRKNHPSLLCELTDLEGHICLYFAAVNRARLFLVHHLSAQSDPNAELPL
ncbi:hypothetical protein VPH35_134554 [Triticum aestivum]